MQELSILMDIVWYGLTLIDSDATNVRIIRKRFAKGSESGCVSLEAIQTNHVVDDPAPFSRLGLLYLELREVFFFKQVMTEESF